MNFNHVYVALTVAICTMAFAYLTYATSNFTAFFFGLLTYGGADCLFDIAKHHINSQPKQGTQP